MLALLTGCPFFTPPEPGPMDDGLLQCDEVWTLEGEEGGSNWLIDASPPVLLRLTWDLSGGEAFFRLSAEGQNSAPLVDGRSGTEDTRMPLLLGAANVRVALVSPDGAAVSGNFSLSCDQPLELCSNLADDDGDGSTDCADVDCGWDDGCGTSQAPFLVEPLPCPPPAETLWLSTDTFGPLDDQWTRYDAGDRAPWFWGGAEVVLVPDEAVDSVSLVPAEPGWVCAGTDASTILTCESAAELAAGTAQSFVGNSPLWVEPDAAHWTELSVTWTCGT